MHPIVQVEVRHVSSPLEVDTAGLTAQVAPKCPQSAVTVNSAGCIWAPSDLVRPAMQLSGGASTLGSVPSGRARKGPRSTGSGKSVAGH